MFDENPPTRREFLKDSIRFVSAGILLSSGRDSGPQASGSPPAAGSGKSKVVITESTKLREGEDIAAHARGMAEACIVEATGRGSETAAWKELFSPSDTVGIKVNCLGGRLISPRPEIVNAIAAGLISAGIRPENIVVWDRTTRELSQAGIHAGNLPQGVRAAGTDHPGFGYDSDLTEVSSVASCLSRIVSAHCTALINVSVLKDHDLAGVSLCLKNYFGAIHNPNKLHASNCDPYVADVNRFPALRNKTRLYVCDATRILYNGGPSYKPQWCEDYFRLMMSTDPVAIDRVGLEMIEAKRKEKGLAALLESDRPPKHIFTAGDPSHGLGESSLSSIEQRKVSV